MNNSDYKKLRQAQRIQVAVEMTQRTQAWESVIDIARRHDISRNHCFRLGTKHQTNPEMEDMRRSGRPQKVTRTIERRITREVANNPLKVPPWINERLCKESQISARTYRHYVSMNGIKCYRPMRKSKLEAKHIKTRLMFAKKFVDKDMIYWGKFYSLVRLKSSSSPKTWETELEDLVTGVIISDIYEYLKLMAVKI